jgi:hypothetical protein
LRNGVDINRYEKDYEEQISRFRPYEDNEYKLPKNGNENETTEE